ncbi:MAG: phosphodiester glycosidase family protein [Candidatus Neomarinimicrobiota bacterium]
MPKVNLTLILLLLFLSCSQVKKRNNIPIQWRYLTDKSMPDIQVYKGENKDIPIRAWYVKINLKSEEIKIKIIKSKDEDKKESPLNMMVKNQSLVLINGGFFISDNKPMRHVGLLKTEGILNEPASHTVIKDSTRYYTNRGAFGVKSDGTVDISWCSTKNDSIFAWKNPFPNKSGVPYKKLNYLNSKYWDVYEALHAGPILIKDSKICVSIEEEVFFSSPVAGVQPRSAVGYTNDNYLILIVIDGRQVNSRGVYLEELAIIMKNLGCVNALNLDGGGSSVLLVKEELMNRPYGSNSMRDIMSAISIHQTSKL